MSEQIAQEREKIYGFLLLQSGSEELHITQPTRPRARDQGLLLSKSKPRAAAAATTHSDHQLFTLQKVQWKDEQKWEAVKELCFL